MEPTPVANPYLAPPVQTARTDLDLIAAPDWDTDPLIEMPCPGFRSVKFYIMYLPDADNGAVTFRVEVSPYYADTAGVEDWFTESDVILAAPVLAGGADSVNLIQRQTHTYAEVAIAVQNFEYTFMLNRTVERIRIPCQETGVVGDVGSCHIVALFGM